MKNSNRLRLRQLLFILLFMNGAYAQKKSPATDTAILKIKHTKDFTLSGDGNAAAWSATGWVELPFRSAATGGYRTQMKSLYSDTGIYFLYECEDKKITASLTADFADLYNEDVIEVFLRPDEKQPMYFEYELSPLNYELPILIPNIKGKFFGWQPWHYEGGRRTRHATHINKSGETVTGWTAEFFIPYALLTPMVGKTPKKGDRWRANFYRIDYDKEQYTWQWNLVKNESFHDFERFGILQFD